ncbi:MAG: lysylphosphatidylglycerol synthase transmembrane domain-containing protein [Andreesenia angusta]|nr:lysylphosphatidylglycerol synthase transmembrane domain-containing protein [Andreesenia angusta]
MRKLRGLKENIKKIVYFILFILFIYLLKTIDFKETFESLKSMNVKYLCLALFFQIITIILVNIQWKSIGRWTGRKIRFMDIFKINCIGNIVDSLTPGVKVGGELARIYRMETILKINRTEAIAITGVQKSVSLFSFLILTILSSLFLFIDKWNKLETFRSIMILSIFISILFLFITILIFFRPNLSIKYVKRFIKSEKMKKNIENSIKNYMNISKNIINNRSLLFNQIVLGFVIWLLFAFKLYIVLIGFGININFIDIFPITYITYAIGMIPLLPGSIGSFEASMTFLLKLSSVLVYQGFMISIVFRFITFWFEFIISGLYLLLDKLLKRKGL